MLRTTSSSIIRSFARAGRPAAACPTALNIPSSAVVVSRGMTILSKESADEFKKQNYTTRMAKTRRPVSPHVTIYSFPVCAISSIATRVTGCALSFGCAGLGIVEIFGGSGAALSLMQVIGESGALVAAGAKFSVAFPVVYHYLGGLRHLVWDAKPDLLTNVDVEKASYGLIGASVLVSTVATVL
ncbi:hypothetical protein HJC23_004601 [Cyclotella cryptica]|uniref:Succinate dehydrogenase subunit C n=1 Tax=Cyclotella cryptica TaxID=29204 RepID=A0ABD3QEK5_9STRA|eukprot:CCRYP_005910-RA/>CCRYP_005910-RA protein AED:0.29 eAED:0.29 QI:301/1/1/1/1/1/2/1258/184